jgi:NADPH:quinone reductase-like Zn-dependent oxidoreductase
MKITRLYTGDDNESHFEDVDIPLEDKGAIGMLSRPLQATGIIFRETGAGYDYDWHPAPQRQFVIMLEGAVDIEVSGGMTRRFGPGDIVLAEDTGGRGHISRAVDGKPRRSIFVTLD